MTPDIVTAEIELLRAAENKAILLVEGDSDQKLMTAFVDVAECEIVIAWGRQNCLDAVPLVRKRKLSGVLGLVDADYDEILGQPIADDDIVVCDERDMEVLLFKSGALDRVVPEVCGRRKLASIQPGTHPRDKVKDVAYWLGLLRIVSAHEQIYLTFEGLRYRFVDRRSLDFDRREMIQEVFNNSKRRLADATAILRQLDNWHAKGIDAWRVCSGHDLCAIFGKAVGSVFGPKTMSGEEIESRLRTAFSDAMFQATAIYIGIRAWERRNQPYTVLRPAL